MSRTSENLYEMCLQVSASRYYEVDTEEVQNCVLNGDTLRFQGAGTDWPLYKIENDNCSFWFTIVSDYSGILHCDDLLGLMTSIREFEECYTG